MKECIGIIGRQFGHKYEAVYEYGEPCVNLKRADADDAVK